MVVDFDAHDLEEHLQGLRLKLSPLESANNGGEFDRHDMVTIGELG